MNGKRYLLDTNAFIQLLSGNGSVRTIIDDADFLSTSVICQAEFLAYPKLDPETRNAFLQFLSRIHVYDVLSSDDALMRETVSMRVESGLKLPDAFIAANRSRQWLCSYIQRRTLPASVKGGSENI